MDEITLSVANYIREKGILLSAISEGTGLSPGILYPTLGISPKRKLRVDEFVKICNFLEVDPERFLGN